MRFLIVLLLAAGLNRCISAPFTNYTVTAYCNNKGKGCYICNGKWAKYNKTANGMTPTQGVTCAAPRSIPFGTKLYIEGVGTRTVQDRLAKKYDDRIDIFFNNHSDALKFGKKRLKVFQQSIDKRP